MILATNSTTAFKTAFTNGTSKATADMPREKGGNGDGFGPHELLEAALATCLTMTVQLLSTKLGLTLHGVRCEVRIDRANPDGISLNYSLSFDGPISEEQTRQLRDGASRCPVAKTLSGGLTIKQVEASSVTKGA